MNVSTNTSDSGYYVLKFIGEDDSLFVVNKSNVYPREKMSVFPYGCFAMWNPENKLFTTPSDHLMSSFIREDKNEKELGYFYHCAVLGLFETNAAAKSYSNSRKAKATKLAPHLFATDISKFSDIPALASTSKKLKNPAKIVKSRKAGNIASKFKQPYNDSLKKSLSTQLELPIPSPVDSTFPLSTESVEATREIPSDQEDIILQESPGFAKSLTTGNGPDSHTNRELGTVLSNKMTDNTITISEKAIETEKVKEPSFLARQPSFYLSLGNNINGDTNESGANEPDCIGSKEQHQPPPQAIEPNIIILTAPGEQLSRSSSSTESFNKSGCSEETLRQINDSLDIFPESDHYVYKDNEKKDIDWKKSFRNFKRNITSSVSEWSDQFDNLQQAHKQLQDLHSIELNARKEMSKNYSVEIEKRKKIVEQFQILSACYDEMEATKKRNAEEIENLKKQLEEAKQNAIVKKHTAEVLSQFTKIRSTKDDENNPKAIEDTSYEILEEIEINPPDNDLHLINDDNINFDKNRQRAADLSQSINHPPVFPRNEKKDYYMSERQRSQTKRKNKNDGNDSEDTSYKRRRYHSRHKYSSNSSCTYSDDQSDDNSYGLGRRRRAKDKRRQKFKRGYKHYSCRDNKSHRYRRRSDSDDTSDDDKGRYYRKDKHGSRGSHGEHSKNRSKSDRSSIGNKEKKKGYGSRQHYALFEDKEPDNLARKPRFTDDPLITTISSKDVLAIHKQTGNDKMHDKTFVYRILEKAFGTKLETETLNGKKQKHPTTGNTIVMDRLDPRIIGYLYLQFNERVTAVGINEAEREARASRSLYSWFVRMCTDKERHNMRNRINREKINMEKQTDVNNNEDEDDLRIDGPTKSDEEFTGATDEGDNESEDGKEYEN